MTFWNILQCFYSITVIIREVVARSCSIKWDFQNFCKNSRGNNCAEVTFLKRCKPATLSSRDSGTDFLLWILQSFSKYIIWKPPANYYFCYSSQCILWLIFINFVYSRYFGGKNFYLNCLHHKKWFEYSWLIINQKFLLYLPIQQFIVSELVLFKA